MIAAHKLRADQQAAAYRPEKVAVYSAGMLLDNKGNFTGDTALDYATVKGTLAEGTTEAAIRLALLKSKLDQAYTEFKHDPTHDAQVLGVFTAPEWLFKKPDVSFTQQDKLYIEERCKEYSAACPGMLVVLGLSGPKATARRWNCAEQLSPYLMATWCMKHPNGRCYSMRMGMTKIK